MKKSVEWHSLPRSSRLANVMYPHLSDPETQRDMAYWANSDGKKSPMQARKEEEQPKRRR